MPAASNMHLLHKRYQGWQAVHAMTHAREWQLQVSQQAKQGLPCGTLPNPR